MQLRRSGPRSKTAPVPPKRTSSFRDSTYQDKDGSEGSKEAVNGLEKVFENINRELQDLNSSAGETEEERTPDTEDSESHTATSALSVPNAVQNQSQQQKLKKTRTYPPNIQQRMKDSAQSAKAQPKKVQIAALEVQNVKRAINRYGTLPKGARIGAYLESLRQHGLHAGSQPEPVLETELDILKEVGPDVMYSSHAIESINRQGNCPVVSGGNVNNSCANNARQGSDISRYFSHGVLQRQKSDLTHTKSSEVFETGSIPETHHLAIKPVPSPRLPRGKKADRYTLKGGKSEDSTLSNKEPRDVNGDSGALFGVNLKHRDSVEEERLANNQSPPPFGCGLVRRTLKKRPKDRPPSPPKHNLVKSGSMDDQLGRSNEKSPMSNSASDHLHSPPSSLGSNANSPPQIKDSKPSSNFTSDVPASVESKAISNENPPPSLPNASDFRQNLKPVSNSRYKQAPAPPANPASQLVSELFESLKLKARKRAVEMETGTSPLTNQNSLESKSSPTDQFKKSIPAICKEKVQCDITDSANVNHNHVMENSSELDKKRIYSKPILDRMCASLEEDKLKEHIAPPVQRTSVLSDGEIRQEQTEVPNPDKTNLIETEDENKRLSSGSIHSLKKLWEKESGGHSFEKPSESVKKICPKIMAHQLETRMKRSFEMPDANDPKISSTQSDTGEAEKVSRNNLVSWKSSPPLQTKSNSNQTIPVEVKKEDPKLNDSVPIQENSSDTIIPTGTLTKPQVPQKPPVKGCRPVASVAPVTKPAKPALKPQVFPRGGTKGLDSPTSQTSTEKLVERNENEDDSKSELANTKASIVEISSALENNIVGLKNAASISSMSVIQLTDKVQLFRTSCSGYAEYIPPHGRFRFRELLSRLENQGEQLRTCNSNNSSDSAKLLSDLQNTVRDLVNVVQR